MQIKFASGNSRKELWEIVARRFKTKAGTTSPASLQALESKLRDQGAKTPSSSCRETRKWVQRAMKGLDTEPLSSETKNMPSFHQLAETFYQILIMEVKKLRWKTAGGLDNISAAQIKRAPPAFLRALALFAARCAWLKCFPRWFRLARATFIPKPEEGKFRGLRLESLLTKLVEKCILHPFFPAVGPEPAIIAPEHFADRKKVSAEMTAGILAIIVDLAKTTRKPLYILIADAKEAYDMVWREGLWAKLVKTHARVEDVRRARAMYEHMGAQIVEENFASSIVSLLQGLPQGGPCSGKLFAFFNSDLPEELRNVGAGTVIGRTELTCSIYLDDSMIPSHSEDVMRRTLLCLEEYGDRWSQHWSTTKFKMLCMNVSSPPEQWLFKGTWFDTVQAARYLGIHFDPRGGWGPHFAKKRAAALLLRLELRRAGLFGGKNSPADSLEVARSKLWATIDYGRGTASSQGSKCKTIAKALDSFHLETLREILGVSSTSRKAGVRGETGEIPDAWRERKRQLLTARQMLAAPKGGQMEKVAREANAGTPKLGIFRVVNEFLEEHAGPKIETFRNKMEIKRWVLTKASEEWKTKVTNSSTLARTYRHSSDSTSLALKGYLKRTYPGRQILTRLHLDDLNLGAAGYRGQAEQKRYLRHVWRRGRNTRTLCATV